jgi:hypothetical protein
MTPTTARNTAKRWKATPAGTVTAPARVVLVPSGSHAFLQLGRSWSLGPWVNLSKLSVTTLLGYRHQRHGGY